jgi:hypothetical protein
MDQEAAEEAEEAEFRAIGWKPNDKGLPGRRLPADYIMRKDRNARRAYLEMRSNLGLTHEEAELRIERLHDANFRTAILSRVALGDLTEEEIENLDRRPDMWVQLARGFTVEQIFPDLEDLGMVFETQREQVYVAMKGHPHYAIPGGVITLQAARKYDGRKVNDAFWDEFLAEDWLEIVEGQPALAANGQLQSLFIEGDTVRLDGLLQ